MQYLQAICGGWKMKLYLLSLFVVLMFTAGSGLASQRSMQSGLKPIGSGEIRYMGIIKVYDASLSASREVTGDQILDKDISKCLNLHYAVSLTRDKFIRGAEMVLQRQHSKEAIQAVQQYIDVLHAKYRDVQEGDSYSLCYDAPSRTTTLSLNREKLVSIASVDFARLYFGIWLGSDAPIDKNLRSDLLATNR